MTMECLSATTTVGRFGRLCGPILVGIPCHRMPSLEGTASEAIPRNALNIRLHEKRRSHREPSLIPLLQPG